MLSSALPIASGPPQAGPGVGGGSSTLVPMGPPPPRPPIAASASPMQHHSSQHSPGGGGLSLCPGSHSHALTLSMEKLLESAAASGELRLCSRNLKAFPKNCCKFQLEDTVLAGKN